MRYDKVNAGYTTPPVIVAPWQSGPITHSYDPKTCHCGATALYKMGDKGFCRTHQSDAVTAARKMRTRGER